MLKFERHTIWTIGLSIIVIIGAGHGIGFLGLLEIVGLFHGFNVSTEDFSLSLNGSYDKSISSAALFAFGGHFFLLLSIILRENISIYWTRLIGLLLLWFSFYYLTHNLFVDTLAQIGFLTGLPFLIVSINLFY